MHFFPSIFLSLSLWKSKEISYWSKTFVSLSFPVEKEIIINIRRFGIRDWWNHLMNSLFIFSLSFFFQGTKCRYCMSFSRVSLLFNTKGINFMASKTSCVSPDLQFLRTNRAKNIWDKKTKLVIHLQCTKIDSFFFTYNYLLTWLLKFILVILLSVLVLLNDVVWNFSKNLY